MYVHTATSYIGGSRRLRVSAFVALILAGEVRHGFRCFARTGLTAMLDLRVGTSSYVYAHVLNRTHVCRQVGVCTYVY